MTTVEIIDEFNKIVNLEQEYTLTELKTILGNIYKEKNGKKVAVKKSAAKKEEKCVEDAPSDEEKVKKRGRPAKEPKLNAKGEEKKKREPTAYNIFIKEKYAELKAQYETLNQKEIMLLAAAAWKAKKADDEEKKGAGEADDAEEE